MKLSAYIDEIAAPILSNEDYNEMVDELEAIGEAHKAHKRLVALEALNANTNTAQYQLAMETILTPVGLGHNTTISAEGLGDKIKGVASRVWAAVLRLIASIKNRVKKMYEAVKNFILRTKIEDSFLKDYKTIIEKKAPDSAKDVIKALDAKLEKCRHKAHHNAYADKTVAKRLAHGDTKANHAFKMMKIKEDGTNDSEDNVKETDMIATSIKADAEVLVEVLKSANGWMEELNKVAAGAGAGDASKEEAKDKAKEDTKKEEEKPDTQSWAMEGDDEGGDKKEKDLAAKRVQAALSAVTSDIATIQQASSKIGAALTAFAAAEKKYTDKKDDDKKDGDKKDDKKEEEKK